MRAPHSPGAPGPIGRPVGRVVWLPVWVALACVGCKPLSEVTTPEAAFAEAVEAPPAPVAEQSSDKGRFVALETLLGRRIDELPPEACGPDASFEAMATAGDRASFRCLFFRGPHDAADEQTSDLDGWSPAGTAISIVTEAERIVFAIAVKAYPDAGVANRVFAAISAPLEGWDCPDIERGDQAIGVAGCASGPGFGIAQVESGIAPEGGEIHQVFLQVSRDRDTAAAVLPLLAAP